MPAYSSNTRPTIYREHELPFSPSQMLNRTADLRLDLTSKASSAPGFVFSVPGTILCLLFAERWTSAKTVLRNQSATYFKGGAGCSKQGTNRVKGQTETKRLFKKLGGTYRGKKSPLMGGLLSHSGWGGGTGCNVILLF